MKHKKLLLIAVASLCVAAAGLTASCKKECKHEWDDGVITTASTCKTAGTKTFTCAKCSDTYTEEISAIGHS